MRGRALADFLSDLLAGDLVAWGLLGAFVLFLLFLAVVGFFIVLQKKRRDEEWKRRRGKYKGPNVPKN